MTRRQFVAILSAVFGLASIPIRSGRDFKLHPSPPQAGAALVITVPHVGPWFVYITHRETGALIELGPLDATAASQIEIEIPAGTEGDRLTITDEREPLPTDADYPIVSTD